MILDKQRRNAHEKTSIRQRTSIIDSQLTYAGYDIDDLANNAEFEEIIFLLWHYRLPNAEELKTLKEKLLSYMELNPRVYSHFKEYATDNVHPMTALRTSVSYIAHFDPKAEAEDDTETLERSNVSVSSSASALGSK